MATFFLTLTVEIETERSRERERQGLYTCAQAHLLEVKNRVPTRGLFSVLFMNLIGKPLCQAQGERKKDALPCNCPGYIT